MGGEVQLSGMGEEDVELALDSTGKWWDNVMDANAACGRTALVAPQS